MTDADARLEWIAHGRRAAASEIRSAILDVLHPDDPPARDDALRECIGIAERNGGLDPTPDSETGRRRNVHCSRCGDTRGGPLGHETSECTWRNRG